MTEQDHFVKQLSPLFSMSRDAVLGLDGQTVVWGNPAAETLFGGPVAGKNIRELIPMFPQSIPSEHYAFSAEVGGRAVSVACAGVGAIQLLTIPQDAELTEVPYQLLNEIRSSVFSLKLAADQLVRRLVGNLDPRVGAQAAALYHNYYSIQRLVNNLYTTGLIAGHELQLTRDYVDLGKRCAQLIDSLQSFAQKRDISLEFNAGQGRMAVQADWPRLEQMLLNLISNSLRHTPPGGRIVLSLTRRGTFTAILVQDSGEGIPPERLADIFSLRGSVLPELHGGGTGLFIARGIAQAHGGRLLINSRVDRGTTVQVLLPTYTGLPPLTLRDSAGHSATSSGGSILTELSGVLSSDSYIPHHFR